MACLNLCLGRYEPKAIFKFRQEFPEFFDMHFTVKRLLSDIRVLIPHDID